MKLNSSIRILSGHGIHIFQFTFYKNISYAMISFRSELCNEARQ